MNEIKEMENAATVGTPKLERHDYDGFTKALVEERPEAKSLIKRLADLAEKRSGLTFKEFSSANKKRCEDVFHPINSWKLNDWAIALIGEFGEAMNILKKIKRVNDGTDPLSDLNALYPALMEEIADIVTYADLLLTSEGYVLEEELIKKFNIVSEKRGSGIKL